MKEQRYSRISRQEAVEQDLEDSGFIYDKRTLGREVMKKEREESVIEKQEDLLSILEAFRPVMRYLGEEPRIPTLHRRAEFQKCAGHFERLRLVGAMHITEALLCLYSGGDAGTRERLEERMKFYNNLASGAPTRRVVEGMEWDEEANEPRKVTREEDIDLDSVTPKTVRTGFFRDLVHITMAGSPERAVYNLAMRRCKEEGIVTTHMPPMRGVHSNIFADERGVEGGSFGLAYPSLHALLEDAAQEVGRRARRGKGEVSPSEVRRKSVLVASDWLTEAMQYSDPGRSPFSPYAGTIEEALAWARLGSQVKQQLRGMRRKIMEVDLHGIGRFIGKSGDNLYHPQMRKLDQDIRVLEEGRYHDVRRHLVLSKIDVLEEYHARDLGRLQRWYDRERQGLSGAALDDLSARFTKETEYTKKRTSEELCDELRRKREALQPRYERGKSIAQKALDLHFRFDRRPVMRIVDWINQAPFGTISRVSRALQKGVSEETVLAMAISEMLQGGSLERDTFRRVRQLVAELYEWDRIATELEREQTGGTERRGWDEAEREIYNRAFPNNELLKEMLAVAKVLSQRGYQCSFDEMANLAGQRFSGHDLERALGEFTLEEVCELIRIGVPIGNATYVKKIFTREGHPLTVQEVSELSWGSVNGLDDAFSSFALEEVKTLLRRRLSLDAAIAVRSNAAAGKEVMDFDTLCEILGQKKVKNDINDFTLGARSIPLDQLLFLYDEGVSYAKFSFVKSTLSRCGYDPDFKEIVEACQRTEHEFDLEKALRDHRFTFKELQDLFRQGVSVSHILSVEADYKNILLNVPEWASAIVRRQEEAGIPIKIDDRVVRQFYDRSFRRDPDGLTIRQNCIEGERILGVLPAAVEVDILAGRLLKTRERSFADAVQYLFDKNISSTAIQERLSGLRHNLALEPDAIAREMAFLGDLARDYPFAKELLDTARKDEWISTIERLQKMQGVVANEEHDPWKKEFKPLLGQALSGKILSLENKEDAELLFSFVKTVGMVNLPKLLRVFVDCARAQQMDDIPPETVRLFEEFGIRLRHRDGSWRFPKPSLAFNEISKSVRQFQAVLLEDKIPEGINTELGGEILGRLKGSTQWERNHPVADLVATWNRAVASRPEVGRLPSGCKEVSFRVGVIEKQRKESTATETERARLEEFLESQEVADGYMVLARSLGEAVRRTADITEWWERRKGEYLDSLGQEAQELKFFLNLEPAGWHSLVSEEIDEEKKKQLMKKRKMLENPKARIGFERKLSLLVLAMERVGGMRLEKESPQVESDLVSAMEALREVKEGAAAELSRDLSAQHMVQVMPAGWLTRLLEVFREGTTPTLGRLETLSEFARQYLQEHYFHELQQQEHTGHLSFSPALRKHFMSLWQQQMAGVNKLPIELLVAKAKKIVQPELEEGKKGIEITMVPARALLRILAGDIGDACYTSQHYSFAEGQFPGLHAWTYVVNRSRPNEAFVGSLLGVQTVGEDGAPVLVARGNNPRENFIQNVNAEEFVLSSLREVINTAKRMREERIRANPNLPTEQKRQYVVVPLDGSSRSLTNRPKIADVSLKRFGRNRKIGLKNERETNFNGYPTWNKNGPNASGIIWEIDEEGKEKWHGEWT